MMCTAHLESRPLVPRSMSHALQKNGRASRSRETKRRHTPHPRLKSVRRASEPSTLRESARCHLVFTLDCRKGGSISQELNQGRQHCATKATARRKMMPTVATPVLHARFHCLGTPVGLAGEQVRDGEEC